MLCNRCEEMASKPKLDFRGNCRKNINHSVFVYIRKFKMYQCFVIHVKWKRLIGVTIDLICKIWPNISKAIIKLVGYVRMFSPSLKRF